MVRRPPVYAFPDQNIKEVANIMAEKNIGLVVLVSRGNPKKIEGVVSERDIVRAVSKGINLEDKVINIATKDVVTVEVDDPISYVARKMLDNRIRHIVVVDKGELYGVISIRDIMNEVHALQSLVSAEIWEWDEGMTS